MSLAIEPRLATRPLPNIRPRRIRHLASVEQIAPSICLCYPLVPWRYPVVWRNVFPKCGDQLSTLVCWQRLSCYQNFIECGHMRDSTIRMSPREASNRRALRRLFFAEQLRELPRWIYIGSTPSVGVVDQMISHSGASRTTGDVVTRTRTRRV